MLFLKDNRRIFMALAGLVSLAACGDETSVAIEQDLEARSRRPNPRLRRHLDRLSYTTVEGHRMAYLDYGEARDDGVTAILLHGIPTSSFLYRKVAPRLASDDVRVIAPDLLGFGQSDKPVALVYALEDHARRVFALADALGIGSFVLVVHDIGGFVGWEMLAQDASRIEALVVTDTTSGLAGVTPNALTLQHFGPGATLTPRDVWSQLDSLRWAKMAARSFLEQGLSDPAGATRRLVNAYGRPLATGSSEAFIQFFEDLNFKLTPEAIAARSAMFSAYPGPVAIVFGADDGFFNPNVVVPSLAQDFGVPDHRVTIVENAGHYLQEETPRAYVNAVSAFLNDGLD